MYRLAETRLPRSSLNYFLIALNILEVLLCQGNLIQALATRRSSGGTTVLALLL